MRLLFSGSLHILVQILIKEVKARACALINLEEVIREPHIHKAHEDLLDQLEIEFEEHELQMISEEGLYDGERFLVKFLIDLKRDQLINQILTLIS